MLPLFYRIADCYLRRFPFFPISCKSVAFILCFCYIFNAPICMCMCESCFFWLPSSLCFTSLFCVCLEFFSFFSFSFFRSSVHRIVDFRKEVNLFELNRGSITETGVIDAVDTRRCSFNIFILFLGHTAQLENRHNKFDKHQDHLNWHYRIQKWDVYVQRSTLFLGCPSAQSLGTRKYMQVNRRGIGLILSWTYWWW